jgi:hypothetical protein
MTAASLVRLGLRGQAGVLLRAKVDALRELPRVLRKRSIVQRSRRASARGLLGAMAMVPTRG